MIYCLLLAISVGCPLASFIRFRSVIHPHFVFTASWVFLVPIGALVSPTLPAFLGGGDLDAPEVFANQIVVILFFLAVFVTTMLYSRTASLSTAASAPDILRRVFARSSSGGTLLALPTILVLTVQLAAEIMSCHWSLSQWFEFTIGPRGMRPWSSQTIGGEEYVFTLITSLAAVCPVTLPLAISKSKGFWRVVCLAFLPVMLFMEIGDGSRTPVAVTLAMFVVISQYRLKIRSVRLATQVALVAIFIGVGAMMVVNRNTGYAATLDVRQLPNAKYQQDDNYYQLVHVLQIDDSASADHWNATKFFLSLVVNPIPRYFWKNKPLLDESYFGDWKGHWVTITDAGDCIALFGKWAGLPIAVLFELVLFHMLSWSYRFIGNETGLAFYMTMWFYTYMAQRSIHGLGVYIVPISFMLMLLALSRIFATSRNKKLLRLWRRLPQSSPRYPAHNAIARVSHS